MGKCWWWLALLLGAAPISGAIGGPASEGLAVDRVEAALAGAVGWVERHPATPADGGLSEMVDERLLLRLLGELAATPEERARLAEALRAHLARLEPAFALWVRQPAKTLWDHYHLVLAAHVMRGAGRPSRFEPVIVAGAQQALIGAPDEHPTVRLAIALFIEGLGEPPAVPVETLLGDSLIERIHREGPEVVLPAGPRDPQRVRMEIYALVHELLALTDFGRRAATPWLAERTEGVHQVLPEALGWARRQGELDLACELVVTGRLLGLTPPAALLAVVEDLVRGQRPDGSWGASPSTRLQNPARHTVLTGIVALWAYRGTER